MLKSRRLTTSIVIAHLFIGLCLANFTASAAPKPKPNKQTSSINIVPTITSVTIVNGQLFASGVATAEIKGRQYTAPFSNVPITMSLAPTNSNGVNGVAACPILNLTLGPIHLDLLGLVVDTSPICLTVTAFQGGGLLGDLLCSIANLLDTLPLDQILGALNSTQLGTLTNGLTNLFNGALGNLLQALLGAIIGQQGQGMCDILNLSLGPLNLNLLGLEVILNNCDDGPITVDVTAHHGGLLGNLLCNLLHHGSISLGSLLGDIIAALLRTGPL
jgi:hypothetical protein